MKNLLFSVVLLAAPVLAAEAPKPAAPKPAEKTAAAPKADAAPKDPYKKDEDRVLYTMGFMMARNVAPFQLTAAELKVLQAGFTDSATAKAPSVDVRFYQSRINDFLMARMAAKNKPYIDKNKPKGAAWAKRFAEAAGGKAVALPNGAYYLEKKAGTGPTPSKMATIKAHYRGTYEDGKEFDSSYSRGEPTQFSLQGVIPCWTDAFPLIKVGGSAELMCPGDSGYGDVWHQGIEPATALHFDVELVEIVNDPQAPAKTDAKPDAKKK